MADGSLFVAPRPRDRNPLSWPCNVRPFYAQQRQKPLNRQRGAALLLALLIALTISLTFFFKAANSGTTSYGREQATEEALAQAKAALIGFAATYRDKYPDEAFGYLLCRDVDNDGDSEGAICGAKGLTMIGRFPFKTLELPDLRAADGECLWYIVSGSHKDAPKSDPPFNWDARGQIRVQDMNGVTLIDPSDESGGAVAVIIAPGPQLSGQNRPASNLRCSGDASNSISDYLDGAYTDATAGTLTVIAGEPGSKVNNDRVTWISARELFVPIARRLDLLGQLLTQLTNCLNVTGAQHIPTANKSAAGPSKWVSDSTGIEEVRLALGSSACSALASPPVKAIWDSWKDHFRYVVCDPASAKCIQVNGVLCSGAILFGGRMATGNPRTAAEKLVLTNYFDAANVTALTTAANSFSGNAFYLGTAPQSDIAICLQPGP